MLNSAIAGDDMLAAVGAHQDKGEGEAYACKINRRYKYVIPILLKTGKNNATLYNTSLAIRIIARVRTRTSSKNNTPASCRESLFFPRASFRIYCRKHTRIRHHNRRLAFTVIAGLF